MPPGPANFVLLVEMGFLHVGHAGLELLTSADSPASASQSVGITGVSHCAPPSLAFHGGFVEEGGGGGKGVRDFHEPIENKVNHGWKAFP